jgi:hypothetical protein
MTSNASDLIENVMSFVGRLGKKSTNVTPECFKGIYVFCF